MTIQEFEDFIYKQSPDDYVVKLRLRYSEDEEWEYLNEIIMFENGTTLTWLDDWYEGQNYVEILGYMLLRDVVVPQFEGGCGFCEGWQRVHDKETCSDIWLSGKFLRYDNSSSEYAYGTAEINYCPICGRKL